MFYRNGNSAKLFSVFCNDKDFLRVVHPFLIEWQVVIRMRILHLTSVKCSVVTDAKK